MADNVSWDKRKQIADVISKKTQIILWYHWNVKFFTVHETTKTYQR